MAGETQPRRHRLAAVALHPIQYQAGLWRVMAAHPRLDLDVIFLDTIGIDGTVDPTLKAALKWDTPLLDGYPHDFVKNLSPFRFTPIVDRVNPTLYRRLGAKRYDAVIVHGFLTLSNWIALAAARRSGAHPIFRGEAYGQESNRPRAVKELTERVHGYYLRSCDGVAYSCENNRDYLLARGARPNDLFPMPCAVDNEQLEQLVRSAAPPEQFRKRHGLPDSATLLVTVGRFVHHKRIEDCLAALAEPVLRGRDDLHLLVAGDGPDREKLEVEAQRLGVSERVHFLGFLSQQQLVEAILAAQLFVLASSRDASPKAMSEALYLRKPVVCSDHVGTSKDLIEPGGNGFIYPCGDVAALAGYTARILDDEATRRGMGEHSHEIARRNDFPAGVESLVAKLDELAGVGGRRP